MARVNYESGELVISIEVLKPRQTRRDKFFGFPGSNLFTAGAVLALMMSSTPVTSAAEAPAVTAPMGSLEAGLILSGLMEPVGYLPDPAISLGTDMAAPPLQAGMVAARDAAETAMQDVVLTVEKGDTLMNLLVSSGIDRAEAHDAITALSSVFRPRDLKIGQQIHLRLAGLTDEAAPEASDDSAAAEEGRLVGLSLRPTIESEIAVTRVARDGFQAKAVERPLERRFSSVSGNITSSLALAAQEAGVPANILMSAIKAFSYDVDFQRDLQPGDSFELFFEAFHDADTGKTKTGKMFYGSITLSGTRLELYRHDLDDDDWGYFNSAGKSVRKALLRTPVDGARISSGYGKRKHPVLGYTKMHRGVDFAAPRGTPVYAAGKGVVDYAGRNGAYGKYVRLRHSGGIKTAYAHMSRYGKGVQKGTRVRQGQIIGYVGSTGRSTGPHLHYEILKGNKQVNPRKVKMPSGIQLKGKALARFDIAREEIDRLREESRRPPAQIAHQ